MRISDLMLSNNFLGNLSQTKSKVAEIQNQIATGNQIQSPSDNPNGTVKILGWTSQLDQANTISSNIDSGESFVNDTTQAMQNIQDQISSVLVNLNQSKNPTNSGNMNNFADQINSALELILNSANTQSDGKYVFGGTDFSAAPYGYTSDNSAVEVKVGNVSGAQNIKISPNISQQINITGTDLFGTIVTGSGNIDSGTAAGATVTNQTNVYDASGNQYTFKVNFTKTAANTYDFTYDVLNSSNASVLPSAPAAQSMVFDATTGKLQTVGGKTPSLVNVNIPGSKIDFNFDPSSITQSSGSNSLSFSANQQTSIFNTLIAIKNDLKAGNAPTDAQIQAVTDFSSHLNNQLSEAGNIYNRLDNSKQLLTSQSTNLQSMVSKVQGVDVAKAVMDLQNQDYLLQMSYKLAASVQQQSLMDYVQ